MGAGLNGAISLGAGVKLFALAARAKARIGGGAAAAVSPADAPAPSDAPGSPSDDVAGDAVAELSPTLGGRRVGEDVNEDDAPAIPQLAAIQRRRTTRRSPRGSEAEAGPSVDELATTLVVELDAALRDQQALARAHDVLSLKLHTLVAATAGGGDGAAATARGLKAAGDCRAAKRALARAADALLRHAATLGRDDVASEIRAAADGLDLGAADDPARTGAS